MVYGAFRINGILELKKIKTIINSIGYQEILKSSLNDEIYNIVQNKNEKIFFQQDNCSIHKSKSTLSFLKKQKKYHHLEWPSKSPDLNTIENIWGHLTYKIYGNDQEYYSLKELEKAIFKEWSLLDKEYLKNLISDMKIRMKDVIDNKGDIIIK